MIRAFFFDMDGVIFNSMPHHAIAWERAMNRYGFDFKAYDAYLNEGRTGASVINEYFERTHNRKATKEEIDRIYGAKTDEFNSMGMPEPIDGIYDVLKALQKRDIQIWIVTGSGQDSLMARLNRHFPGIFSREHMITAHDVHIGKPDREPYWLALTRSGLQPQEAIVVENAPLGVRSGKAAGLYTIAVNTGPLNRQVLIDAGADIVLQDMKELQNLIANQITNLAQHSNSEAV